MTELKLKKALSDLKRVLAEATPDLLNKVQQAGFNTIEDTFPYLRQYKERTDKYAIMSGELLQNDALYQNLKKQLASGEIIFSFNNKTDLGRMRALVYLVCLRNGYIPQFEQVNGEERFNTIPQKPLDYDSYGTRYQVSVRPVSKPGAQAFYKLDTETRRKLYQMMKATV